MQATTSSVQRDPMMGASYIDQVRAQELELELAYFRVRRSTRTASPMLNETSGFARLNIGDKIQILLNIPFWRRTAAGSSSSISVGRVFWNCARSKTAAAR